MKIQAHSLQVTLVWQFVSQSVENFILNSEATFLSNVKGFLA